MVNQGIILHKSLKQAHLGLFRAPTRLSLSEIHVLPHSRSRKIAGTELKKKKNHIEIFLTTVPTALRERNSFPKNAYQKSSPKPFPPRCGNGIKFSKDSPQKIPKKPFPLCCGNGIN
jgi:hypothetical protein